MTPEDEPKPEQLNSSREERLARVFEECCNRVQAGERLDIEAIAAANPDLAPDLGAALEALHHVRRTAEKSLPLGSLGDYQILSEINRGGMGVIYEAWHAPLDRIVALKVLPEGLLGNAKAVLRFLREAKVTARLHHPNIVSVYDLGVEGGRPYFAMELVRGETLAQVIRRLVPGEGGTVPEGPDQISSICSLSSLFEPRVDGKSPIDDGAAPPAPSAGAGDLVELNLKYCLRAAEAFAGAAEALYYAHSRSIIHRDIKPSNLMLDQSGRLRILDFGLAHLQGLDSLTRSGELLGTPLYMSPEQAQGRMGVHVDHRTDIYSLGATMYEMLSLRPPFRGNSYQETIGQIIFREPPELRSINPRIPRELETIVNKCMEKEPAQRYATAEAVAQDLHRFVRGDPIEARPRTFWEGIVHKLRRRKGRVAVVGLIALLLLTSGMLVRGYLHDLNASRRAEYGKLVQDGAIWIELGQPIEGYRPAGGRMLRGLAPRDLTAVAFADSPEVVEAMPDPAVRALAVLRRAAEIFKDRPDAHYHLARAYLLLRQPEEARAALSRALACDPGFLPAQILQATTADASDAKAARRARLEIALRDAGSPWAAKWMQAWRARQERKWKEAAEAYSEVMHLQPLGVEPYLGFSASVCLARGQAYLEAGDLDLALEDFAAAQGRWPELIDPPLLIAKAYWLKGNQGEADKRFAALHAAHGRSSEVALRIAVVYLELGQAEKGLAWLEENGAKGPLREVLRSRFLRALKRPQEAIAAANEAIALDPTHVEPHIRLADALLDNATPKEAEAEYRRALAMGGESSEVQGNLGVALAAQRKFSEAADAYLRALALDPQNGRVRINLGSALRLLGRHEEAIAQYQALLDNGQLAAQAHNGLGTVYMDLARHEDAHAAFQAAVKLDPKLAWAYVNLGNYLFTVGQFEDAIASYRRALEIEPKFSDAHACLAMSLRQLGEVDRAEEAYRAAIDYDEENAVAHNGLGTILGMRKRFDEAIVCFDRAMALDAERADMYRYNVGYTIWRAVQEGELEQLRVALAGEFTSGEVHDRVLREVLRRSSENEIDERVARAIARVEARIAARGEGTSLELRSRAYWLLRNSVAKEPEKAIASARQAVMREDTVDARLDLADILRETEGAAAAVPVLEKSVEQLGAHHALVPALAELRRGLLPDLVTYRSVDEALEEPRVLFEAPVTWRIDPAPAGEHGDAAWAALTFDDAAWTKAGAGVERQVETVGRARHIFSVSPSARFVDVRLMAQAPACFVVYLNGVEAGRTHTDSVAGTTGLDIALSAEALRPGENVIAIGALEEAFAITTPQRFPLEVSLSAHPFPDPTADRARFTAFCAAAGGKCAAGRLAYFDARLLQRVGRHAEALPILEELVRSDRSCPEPFVRLGESLRALGARERAAACLSAAIEEGLVDSRDLVQLWFAIHVSDLKRGIADMLAALPATASGPIADLRWALASFEERGAVRINCGGEEYRSPKGVTWGRDRFFTGGIASKAWQSRLEVRDTDDDVLHATERYFAQTREGYRIPVIPGTYRVKLHFAEWAFNTIGQRRFAAAVEGKRIFEEYEPKIRQAEVHTVEVPVDDGFVDIVFFHGTRNNPKISALEVEKIDQQP